MMKSAFTWAMQSSLNDNKYVFWSEQHTKISLKDVPLLHRQSYLWVMLEEIRLSCKQYLDQLMSQLGAAAVVDDFHHQDTRSIEVLHKVIEKSSECITLPNSVS